MASMKGNVATRRQSTRLLIRHGIGDSQRAAASFLGSQGSASSLGGSGSGGASLRNPSEDFDSSLHEDGLALDARDNRLLKADQILLATVRSWKLGDKNNPQCNIDEATQYATSAWNLLLEDTQHPIVWYLGLAYEMLFYGIVQIVFMNVRGKQKPKRFSMSFGPESLKHLCKSFKGFSETFPMYRPTAYRCKGIMYVLKGKQQKSAHCFRKAIKHASKLNLVYEEKFSQFLLREKYAEVVAKNEATILPPFEGCGTSRNFVAAFELTFQTWITGVPSSRSDMLRVLTSSGDLSASPSRRSIFLDVENVSMATLQRNNGFDANHMTNRRISTRRSTTPVKGKEVQQQLLPFPRLPPTHSHKTLQATASSQSLRNTRLQAEN